MPHMKGPWTVGEGPFRHNIYAPDPGAGPNSHRIVACCDLGKLTMSCDNDNISADNARLIAAAPALLAACKGMLAVWDNDEAMSIVDSIEPIRAAVALAEKGTSS